MHHAVLYNEAAEAAADTPNDTPSFPILAITHHTSKLPKIREDTEDESQYAILPPQQLRHPLGSLYTTKTPFCRPPNATERQRPLPSEVDRMPSTTANSKAPIRSDSALSIRHATLVDTDEERLLGGPRSVSRNNDAGAVPIGKPQTRPVSHVSAVKIPRGGPRPINTLNGHPKSTTSRVNQVTRSKLKAGFQHTLQTEVSRGGNVRGMPHAIEVDTGVVLPSAKRQKTRHQPSSPSSPLSIIDPLDNEPPGSISFGTLSQSASRAPSVHSRRSSFQLRRSSSSTGSLQEHKNIERLMNSDPISKKKQRRLNNHNQQHHNHSANMSYSNPIDLSGDDEEEMDVDFVPTVDRHVPYQGTMRKDDPTARHSYSSQTTQDQSMGKRSPYFPSITGANGTLKQQQTRSASEVHNGDQPRRLNDMFVPVNGLRRTSDVAMSSDLDELQEGGNTVGHTADTDITLSTTHSRRTSPVRLSTSASKHMSSTEFDEGLPESTIKPSTFATEESKIQKRAQEPKLRVREKKPRWAVEVAAWSYGGEFVEQPGLSLVFDESDRFYALNRDGKPTKIRIRPDKLQKIQCAVSGGKVRFMSSKSEKEEHMLDLQFHSDRDATVLVTRLADQAMCKTQFYPRDQMDKMFKKSRQEFSRITDLAATRGEISAKVRNAPSTWQRGDENIVETRRRRTGPSLVDQLLAQAGLGDSRLEEKKTNAPTNGLPDEPTISEALRIMRPQPHNDHLRRSTRTYRATTKASEDPFDELDNATPKYSKLHGLGKPWSKPLIYPKEGKKRITVEWSDLEKLDEGEFLNDNLLSFYLRFLEQQLGDQKPHIAKKVYFFNSYFFATLTNTHKSKKGFNYEGVQKWTRSVDLFTYDYIIVPINESFHWYLAIICNLPALDRSLEMPEEDHSSPAEAEQISEYGKAREFRPPSLSLEPEDTVGLAEDSKEEGETETRKSFADMSLDNDIERPTARIRSLEEVRNAETAERREQDQAMLDAQFEGSEPGSAASKARDPTHVQERIEDDKDTIEDLDQSPRVRAKSKKQKRKSMPPSITKKDPTKPVILVLDSVGFSRGGTVRVLKDYLREEARTKRGGMEFDDGQIQGINAKVPQQSNYSDCGLFLLGYVAKFLEDDPRDFIASIIARTYDEDKDWTKLVPSAMRASIREQLQQLHKTQEEERQSAKRIGKFQDKGDQKSEASPTRTAPRQIEVPRHDTGMFDRTSISKPAQRPPMDATKTEEPVQNRHPVRVVPEGGKAEHPGISGNQEGQAKASAFTEDCPPVMEIESQSQTAPSAPRSTRTSPAIFDGQNSRPDAELPSEVPDSQPSEPSKSFEQAVTEQAPQSSTDPKRSETVRSSENIVRNYISQKNSNTSPATMSHEQQNFAEGNKVTVEYSTARLGKRDDDDGASRRKMTKKKMEDCGMIDVIDVDD